MAEPQSSKSTVTIVGADLAGTLLACSLARAGWRVDLHEKRPEPPTRRCARSISIRWPICASTIFIEMRDRIGSRLFVFRKKLGLLLHRLFPRWYVPLYVTIEFTRIPYADAVRRARRQDWVVRGIVVALFIALVLLGVLLIH